MIFLIIFAFDPLAVILTIGSNMAILERKRSRGHVEHGLEVFEEMIGREDELHELDNPIQPTSHLHTNTEEPEPHIISEEQIDPVIDEDITDLYTPQTEDDVDTDEEQTKVDDESKIPDLSPEEDAEDALDKLVEKVMERVTIEPPEPTIPSEFSAIPPNVVDADRIEKMLDKLQHNPDVENQGLLDEMQARKAVTERVRNPDKE